MRILDSETSKEIDRIYIEEYGMPSIAFMEIAAVKAVQHIEHTGKTFAIIVGPGNNGGDGLAIARHLLSLNKEVLVCIVNEKGCTTKDYISNLKVLEALGVNIERYGTINSLKKLGERIREYDVVVDSIFGVGLNRMLTDFYIGVIEKINENANYIIAIDVPSGMDSTSGVDFGNVIKADKTITFQGYKKGFLNYNIIKKCGEVIVEKLGVPEIIYNKVCEEIFLSEKKYISSLIPTRRDTDHKGSFGRVLLIAGSSGFQGAAYIATESCVRAGAGLVTLATDNKVYESLSSRMIEAMCISLEEDIEEKICNSSSIAIGPGLGNNDRTFQLIKRVLAEDDKNIIIDADGINVLKDRLDILKNSKSNIILSPHPGEFARLIGKNISDVNADRINLARRFAKEYNVNLILKGYNTIIASPEKCYINTTGNSSMANGGMGDCLTGILCALSAQIENQYDAAVASVFIHGYAADEISKNQYVVNARDIIEKIPYFINKIKKHE